MQQPHTEQFNFEHMIVFFLWGWGWGWTFEKSNSWTLTCYTKSNVRNTAKNTTIWTFANLKITHELLPRSRQQPPLPRKRQLLRPTRMQGPPWSEGWGGWGLGVAGQPGWVGLVVFVECGSMPIEVMGRALISSESNKKNTQIYP